MKLCRKMRSVSRYVLPAVLFFVAAAFSSQAAVNATADESTMPTMDSLITKDAVILTLGLQEGIWLDTTLAVDIDAALTAVRSELDTLAGIHAFPDYIPDELLLSSSASWTQPWREGNLMTGNEAIDSLTVTYQATAVEPGGRDAFTLTYAQALKMSLLADVYEAVPGVVYAEPNYIDGDGNDIDAFRKDGVWHVAFSLGFGDCPAGCMYRYYWYVTVRPDLIVEPVDERPRDLEAPWLYLWNIPARYAATLFSSVGELFSMAASASEWWVRRHAVEVIGRLFVWQYPWVGEDLANRARFDALKNGVLSRRAEVLRILQGRMSDPDPDVRAAAQIALNRVLGLPEGSLSFYFPLHVNNSWTFGSKTIAVVDTRIIDGKLYYLFDNGVLKRMTEDNKLVVWNDSTEQLWVDFSAEVGDSWPINEFVEVSLAGKADVVEVPAGTFSDCYVFSFRCDGADCDWVEWYAPGIGLVKWILFGFAVIEYPLKRAVIDGIAIPGLKGDVDGDGHVDVGDVMLVVSIIINLFDPTPDELWAADHNDDGAVNVLDVVGIVSHILGDGAR